MKELKHFFREHLKKREIKLIKEINYDSDMVVGDFEIQKEDVNFQNSKSIDKNTIIDTLNISPSLLKKSSLG